MAWTVQLKESVIEDLRYFGRKKGRLLLQAIQEALEADPLLEAKNMKTLRPNPVAQRELRLLGEYRALFNVDRKAQEVTVMLVGEKRGNALFVQGQEFTRHHESDSAE